MAGVTSVLKCLTTHSFATHGKEETEGDKRSSVFQLVCLCFFFKQLNCRMRSCRSFSRSQTKAWTMGEWAKMWISFSKVQFLFKCKFVHNARTFSRCGCRSDTCLRIRLSMCFCNLTQKHGWCCYSRIRTKYFKKSIWNKTMFTFLCSATSVWGSCAWAWNVFITVFISSQALWCPVVPVVFTWFTTCVVHVSTRACHLQLYLTCKIEKCLFCIHQRGFGLSPNKTWTLITLFLFV